MTIEAIKQLPKSREKTAQAEGPRAVERDQSTAATIGKTSATERDANSSDRFNFWLAPNQIVNPFDIVQVAHVGQALDKDGKPSGKPSRSYGLVTTIEHRTDSPNHLANYVSSNFGDVTDENPNTPRVGTNVAKVNILSNNGEVYMPVQSDRPVTFASPEGIQEALGIDTMAEKNRVPAGLIKMSNGATTVAYLDQEFVLGPEGAHINISGISGLATKTSYAMFMLQSILQKAEKTKDEGGAPLSEKIAVIILNVKQGDLLQIDQRADKLPSVEQMEMWEAMNLEPRPFTKVRYLLPRSNTPGTPNSFLEPASGYQIFAYGLHDTADKLDLLLSDISDQSGAMDALVGDVMQGLINREPSFRNCASWDNLLNGEPLVKNGKTEKWGDHYVSTIGKLRRHLRRIIRTRSTGLFANARARNELNLAEQIREIEGGHTYVVDIARLTDEEQKLVFGDVLRTVYELKAEDPEQRKSKKPIPEKIIFFVDELNKYAPTGVRGSPILAQVLDIAERGRSLGVVLFSAQQFLSEGDINPGFPFGLAGLWENWRNPNIGEWERTFVIITVPSNMLVAQIHDRMLAILGPKSYDRWLGPERSVEEGLGERSAVRRDPRDLLITYPSEPMTMWPISTRVNAPENDDSLLLKEG